MAVFEINSDLATTDIRPHLDQLRAIAADDSRAGVEWRNAGLVGIVPLDVLRDVLSVYDAYESMRQSGRIANLPPCAYLIAWAQVEHVRCENG